MSDEESASLSASDNNHNKQKKHASEEPDDDEDGDFSESSEEPGLAASLPQRATRGKRFRDLEPEEAEAHEEFWGQQAWAENEEDNDSIKSDEFSSSDFEDSADSDIDLDENDETPDLMHDQDVKDEKSKRKRVVGLAPPAQPKRDPNKPRSPKKPRIKYPLPPSNMTVRRTTASVGQEIEEKQRLEAVRQSLKREKKPKQATEKAKPMTQRQLLEEAARTEIANKESLEIMMLLMAEKKRLREKQEFQSKGARIISKSFRTLAKEEGSTVTYTNPDQFPKAKSLALKT